MFKPNYTITPSMAALLMRVEALRQEIEGLPVTPEVLAGLRETARLKTTHYSTMIEGNRLSEREVADVIHKSASIPSRERDQKEVLGYYAALEEIEQWVKQGAEITESVVKKVHALVMGGGKKKVKVTPYRDGQNVIRESGTNTIVYLPPEAKDVPVLMKELVSWIGKSADDLPCPLRAGIAHYQFATIHPYYDGNGRTARLLATFILHRCGYGLKGFYSLEEYYAKDLPSYYQVLSVGSSHNYYMGRAEADITPWLEYFCAGMVESFENVRRKALQMRKPKSKDRTAILKRFNARQNIVLGLFRKVNAVTSHDVAKALRIHLRTAQDLCRQWVEEGFFVVYDPSKKNRSYALDPELDEQLFGE